MMNEHNIRDIALQMEEHLQTTVIQDLVKLIPVENRISFIKQNYLWSIGKISDEEIKAVCRYYLYKAKKNIIKKYTPKNDVDKLFLEQKSKLWKN